MGSLVSGSKASLKQRRDEAAMCKRLQADPLGGWAAIRRAQGMDPALFEALYQEPSTLEISYPFPRRSFQEREVLEDHPRIDIRYLDVPRPITPETHFTRRLSYPVLALMHVSITVEDYKGWLSARIYFRHGGGVVEQTVGLIQTRVGGRVRPLFVCPVEEKPVEVLAWRDGVFASARAQRLVHRSQIGPNRKRGRQAKKTPSRASKGPAGP